MSVAAPPSARVDRVRVLLERHGLDAILASRRATTRHLSGFVISRGDEATSGWSGTLLITRDRQLLLVDARYSEQAARESPAWEVHRSTHRFADEVAARLRDHGVTRCGAQAMALSHADWSALAAAGEATLVPIDGPLDELRLVKDPHEVAALERAASLTDACFAELLGFIRVGVTERQVAWHLEDWFRANGAEDLAFEPIVLAGPRAAMPHGRPSDAAPRDGEPLLLDFGCQVDGYRSDMTRTVFCGEPGERPRALHALVLRAQQAAYDALRPGATGLEVDAAARAVIDEAGLGAAFSHGLGHGIGLETHEAPMLRQYNLPLRPSMVFTLEPGIYLPGEIGIRIEDDVLLDEDGPRRLTSASRELIVI